VAPIQIVGASACVIFTLHQKTQKMTSKDAIVGYHPIDPPTYLCKQEVGKPSWNAAQLCADLHRVVLMMTLGLMDCGKPWDFGSVSGMLTD